MTSLDAELEKDADSQNYAGEPEHVNPSTPTAAEAPAQLGHVKKMLIGAHLHAVPGTPGAGVLSLGCRVDFRSL